ncbi:hypothetical protein NQ176_g738 [Zarea fungicola]|uniref:Uncharacterized protein n=1 Tax=Zarea fungicola TaxID=93591 RepID=A0ACC1NWZ1_9HYPO|nr:hypothetical protein NQ176_g738 [Lecanicillium fungicola]
MLWYASIVASLAVVGLAWDEGFPVYCNENQSGFCLARLTESCYKCIHPIETGCPGTGKEFGDCFCPIPSDAWSRIEKCFNDDSTGCNAGGDGPTSETFALLNTFAVECNQYNQEFLCKSDRQKLSSAAKKLAVYQCD